MRFTRSLALCLFALSSSAACAGDGCAGCEGMQRIPGGYPRDKAVEGAGALRVTRDGLDLLASEAPRIAGEFLGATNGVATFDIPKATFNPDIPVVSNEEVTICDDGPGGEPPRCRASIQLGDTVLHIDAVTPNQVRLSGTLPLSLSETRTRIKASFGFSATIYAQIGYGTLGGDEGCDGGDVVIDGAYPLPVSINIPVVAETTAPRNGYTKLDLANAEINLDGLSEDQVAVCMDCGFASGACNSVAGWVKGSIVGQLKDGVREQLSSFLSTAFCTKPSLTQDPVCPTGSSMVGELAEDGGVGSATCNFDSAPDRCVPSLLGTDARVNLAQLLAKFSPGSVGTLDFGFAAGGEMTPFPNSPPDNVGYPGHTENGITLSMVGGVLPAPESKCVTPASLEVPQGIPVPTELTQNTLANYGDGSENPDVGLGIAQRFLNYSLKSAYNSGLLCLGVSSEQVTLLQSGLLSVLVGSLPAFTFERKSAAAAIATRPGQPPELTMGGGTDINTDPLIKIDLPAFAIDFYVWTHDRYVRLFTFTADVTVPLNLSTAASESNPAGGVAIQVGNVTLANGKVTNNDMLLDQPEQMAQAISEVVGSLVGQFVGAGITPFDISQMASSFGLTLRIPDGGLRKLEKDSDQFIGLFASFDDGVTAPPAPPRPTLVNKTVHRDAMTFSTYRRELRPQLTISMPAAGPEADLEYATRIDNGPFSAWTPELTRTVSGPEMFLQGRHELRVYARHHQLPGTQSQAAVLPFVIDVLAPKVALVEKAGGFQLDAYDIVSDTSALQARVAYDGAPLGDAWTPLADVAIDGSRDSVHVEVRDEEGNIGSVQQPLIRGNRDITLPGEGGCGSCDAGGQKDTGSGVAWLGAGLFGLWLLGRKRRASGKAVVDRRLLTSVAAVTAASALAPACSCGDEDPPAVEQKTGCGEDCNQPCEPSLPQGIVGSYTSVAKAADGTVWVAGYSDAALSPDFSSLYGDLVVGTYDESKSAVVWSTIDGVPAAADGVCPINDPKGWRSGSVDPGDNVGLWTSIALAENGEPMVAYYDATNKSLRFTARTALKGAAPVWATHEVRPQPSADHGRYVKMIMDGNKPVLAFLQFEPGTDGAVKSRIVLARAKVAVPTGTTDWTFSDVATWNDNPCRFDGCGTGRVCEKGTGRCLSQGSGCTPADCGGSGSTCAMVEGAPTCVSVLAANSVEAYPNMSGIYISLAKGKDGLGIVAYDRVHGNLLGFREKGGTFEQTILDGETGSRANGTAVDTGDTGIGATLTIDDSGRWHVAYVEGLDESLRYLTVDANGTVSKPSVVDDGYGLTATDRFPDGHHVVGDDAAIRLSGQTVTVFYQDATQGSLRYATAQGSGDSIQWTRKAVNKAGRLGGFFPRPIPGESRVASFFRVSDRATRSMTGDVEIIDAK